MTVQVRVGRYSGFSVGIKCNLSDLDAAGRFVLGNGLPDIVTAVLVQCVQLVLINIKLVEAEILHALCGKTAGIACILGTGSNSCFYDGKKITANISPLGYILGDEGSGAVLGKRLVGDLLKHQLPDDLCQDFLKEYDLTPALILDKVYRQPLANRFLAGLTPFLFAHKHRPEIRNLLISCFTDFFTRNVMQYEYHDILVHFTGSIAFFFQEEVKEAALRLNVSIGKVLKSPLEGLKDYHFEV